MHFNRIYMQSLFNAIVDFPIIRDISRHDVIFFNALSDTRHYDARYYISHAVIMVKHCCWGTCRSDSRYAESEHMEGVSWFPFPKPITQLEKCQRWVKLCGRKNFTVANVNKSTYICSKHFLSGRPTEEHPDPIPAAGTSLDILRAQKRKRRVLVRVNSGNVLGPEEKKIKNGTSESIISKLNIIIQYFYNSNFNATCI